MRISTSNYELAKRYDCAEAMRRLRRAGFDACDFSMFHFPWRGGVFDLPGDAFDAYFLGLRAAADACGMSVCQTHAPFGTSDDPAEDAHRFSVIRRAIRATGLLGAPVIVIHPAMYGQYRTKEALAKALDDNIAMYRSLEDDLARAGVKAALENMFGWDDETDRAIPTVFSTAAEMAEALTRLGGDHYCACLDIGHAGIVGQSPAEMIRTLAPWLECLHVHDNDGVTDQHLPPFLGSIDFARVTDALREVGYKGVMNLELNAFPARFPPEMESAVLALLVETARALARDAEATLRPVPNK